MPASTPKLATRSRDRRRRRHPRFQADFRVNVTILLGDRYQKIEGYCNDLSEAGIGILLAAELNVGEVADLSFALLGLRPWELRGVLRYRRGYHYGFEFLTLTDEQKESLRDHFKTQKPID